MPAHVGAAIIWGATGHAKVVHQILKISGISTACFCDRNPAVVSPVPGTPIWHFEEEFLIWLRSADRSELSFVAAMGGAGGASRLTVHAYLSAMDVRAISIAHPTSWIDETATLEGGDQVLAMAAVGVDVWLGKQCIVNTNATVDHDTRVGDGVHVMPGATVAGQVAIGDEAVIGTNATVLPNLHIGDRAIVGAGAVVTRDVAAGTTVVGVPAMPIGSRAQPRSRDDNPWHLSDDELHDLS